MILDLCTVVFFFKCVRGYGFFHGLFRLLMGLHILFLFF